DGRLEELRHRLPPRRCRHSQVLPVGVDYGAAVPTAEARVPVVPVQRAPARTRQAPVSAAERPRPAKPARHLEPPDLSPRARFAGAQTAPARLRPAVGELALEPVGLLAVPV